MPLALVAASFVFWGAAGIGAAAEPDAIWRKLVVESSLVCDEKPLRDALAEFAVRSGVPVWLDRRLDPDRLLSLSVRGSVFEILKRVAHDGGGELACDGQVVMVGLAGRTGRMAAMAAIQRQGQARRAATSGLLETRRFGWQPLSTPSEALAAVEQAWGTSIEGEELPHDLWPAAEYESLDFIAASMLVLGGFDLAIDLSQQRPRAVSLARVPERFTVKYRNLRLPRSVEDDVRAIDEAAIIETGTAGTRVKTTSYGHQAIELHRAAHDSAPAAHPLDEARFDIVVQNKPAAHVLQALATQLGVELVIKADAAAAAESLVSASVQQKTLREIAEIVCAAAGLTCQIGQGQLRVGL